MIDLGLSVREDAIGNIFGTLAGTEPELPAVWTGSHIDTVLHAGMFDGMAGVVAGLEAVRMIQASGASFKRNIEVIVYTSEEPTRFGLGCLAMFNLPLILGTAIMKPSAAL
ncbi:acetylornithine deacetylase/succinyl-diaminopimelate desuccinylase-like protein [Fontibacillus solani]|uniref:Acetylornithine deacetylase/succinyl-diaminopimelate desuccinylase-like protein n=1 Tax=Fontibacillus solani TaxID=1572857 RepID=A0A7W3SQW8_9BACL|nr:M20/M25/M40 family metallo-hydrolase [Fontibacillus solani]MBA9084601.1 acetylornithine deacetylase/succinyl-diaminopimelate desuccinylase-like protein [Fontibacillus solani]